MGLLRARAGKVDERFLLYAYLGPQFQETLRSRTIHGSTVDRIPLIDMPRFPIEVPDNIEEQRAIAHILGTLDDKIELNRRMNETLEAMARALFKSWFVDFDPVRARAEGRAPGLPKPLAALFPDSFEDSELGEIPKGWRVSVLDQLADVVLGGDWGGDEQDAERSAPARCIRGADIPDLQIGGTGKMPLRFLKPSSLAKRRLNDGDLVVEISGGSPTQSTGRPVLVSRELLSRLHLPLVCSNFCRLLKLKSPVLSKFVYLWFRSLYANDEFLQFENGTTGIKNLAFTLVSSTFKFCIPPPAILEAFDLRVAPLFDRQQAGATEADTLTALRDTLLPKLISGEVRVKNAARFAAKVV
jgi:type I restriction enzyme S subunit